jgi:hypothetical protein
MKLIHTVFCFTLVALSLSFQTWSIVHAQEPVRSAPRQRPRISTQLDRATLQKYLDTIEQPGVTSSLKIGYFGGRASTQSLPVAEGFALLQTALKKEPVASKRWFYLQNVRGWAAFRCREISPDEGYAAYSELFDQTPKAKTAKTVYAPQSALIDWIATINGRMGHLRSEDGETLRYDERTTGVLLKAWTAYASLLTQTDGRWNGREPNWSEAINRLGASDEFIAAVEKTLDDPQAKRTFTLMFAAALVIGDKSPQRAFALYVQASRVLPRDASKKIEVPLAARFFDAWLALLVREKKFPQAAEMLHERIRFIGSGHTTLLKQQLNQQDEVGAADTLRVLMLPTAPEAEVLAAAAWLARRWDGNRAQVASAERSAALLNAYLVATRARSLRTELEARFRLGQLLFEQKKYPEAQAALVIAHLKFDESALDASTASTLKSIRDLQARLEKRAEGEEN